MVRVLAGEVAGGARRRGPCRPAFERTGGSAPALLGFAASPACVRWRRSQTKPMRTLGGLSASGLSCSPIVSASRTESAPFWRRLASTTIIRFFKVDVAGWLNCERASASPSLARPRWSYDPVRLPLKPSPNSDVGGATTAQNGSPPITQITFPACRAQLPRIVTGARVGCFPVSRGLPRISGGSASASSLSRSHEAMVATGDLAA